MKKKTLLFFASVGIIAIAPVLSCRKTHNTPATTAIQLNQLFAGLRSTPQSLNVTAGRDMRVYGVNGTILHFYPNSFKDVNGNIITSGSVNLQLIEMYKAGDMIRNRATTMADAQLLMSGGEVNMTATLNGQQVYANKYGIEFPQSEASTQPMQLFYGSGSNTDSVITWTQSNQNQSGNSVNNTSIDSIPFGGSVFYSFDSCNNFDFVNCDWFYSNDSPLTSVSIVLPDTSFNEINTEAYLVLPGLLSNFTIVLSNDGLSGHSYYTASTNTFMILSEGKTKIVPAGMNYKLVAISNKNGNYYYYEQAGVVPNNGIWATANMAADSQSDILTQLQAL